MKIKSILALILATLSANAMALEGKGFTLLSETIESSPGMKGGFIPMAPQQKGYKPQLAIANASAHDSMGRVHENIKLLGNHNFYINNYTREPQVYTYKYELRSGTDYVTKTDRVTVMPGGYASDASQSYVYANRSLPGTYGILASTEVTGETHASEVGYGNLRVSNYK